MLYLGGPGEQPGGREPGQRLRDGDTDPGRLWRGSGNDDLLTFDAADRSDESDSGRRRCSDRGEPNAQLRGLSLGGDVRNIGPRVARGAAFSCLLSGCRLPNGHQF